MRLSDVLSLLARVSSRGRLATASGRVGTAATIVSTNRVIVDDDDGVSGLTGAAPNSKRDLRGLQKGPFPDVRQPNHYRRDQERRV